MQQIGIHIVNSHADLDFISDRNNSNDALQTKAKQSRDSCCQDGRIVESRKTQHAATSTKLPFYLHYKNGYVSKDQLHHGEWFRG